MGQDPWAWANQPSVAPMGNTLQSPRAPEMAPGAAPTQGPLGMAQNMVVAKGVNAGVNTATDPKAWQSLGNTLNPGSVDLVANANASGVDPMQHMLDANSGFNTYAGTAPATAPLSSAAASGTAIGGAEAVTTAAIPVAAETAAASVGAPAAVAAGAGAAEAGSLAAMGGPIGMGVAGLLLAKKFGYI